jgi:hypothetical protein
MKTKREKQSADICGSSKIWDMVYTDADGALKTMAQVEPRVKSYVGVLATTAQGFRQGQMVVIVNSTASPQYFCTGALSSVAAPSGPTSGLQIAPYQTLIFSMGDDLYFISTAGVYVYAMDDSTYSQ